MNSNRKKVEQQDQKRPKQEPMSYVVPKGAKGNDDRVHPVYEARRELVCVQCRATIAVGKHFTKQKHPDLKHGNIKKYPCCTDCYPFVEVERCSVVEVQA